MDKLRRPKKLAMVALAALAIVLAVNAPSDARDVGGHGFAGGHPGGAVGHPGFGGHSFAGHHFGGHHFEGHHFDGRAHGRFGFGFVPIFPDYGSYPAPGYWYYCPSYGAYYPSVASCPEAWVPVPGS